ncbi:MAG: FAD-dependent oxidoreductase [Xanthomonadales bacterium]|nr:FAD-dependent oxidoreductase [Xanthomonadales bacterium]
MGKHCVVIGAGIIGSSCAWHLLRRGLQVTLIDHELPGQSCSFGNASCLATSSVIPFSYPGMIKKVPAWMLDPLGPMRIRPLEFPALIPWFWKFWRSSSMRQVEAIAEAQAQLMHLAFADYDEILTATNSCHLKHAKGAIHIYDTEKEYWQDQWQTDLRARLGFEAHRLGPAEVKSLVPCLNLEKGVAIMMPDWHHLSDPAKVTARIAEHSIQNGVNWVQDKVTAVSANDSGVSLQTESGRQIEAQQLVVAAGAWSNKIARQLDYKVPMIAKRGYHSMISNPGIQLDYPVMSLSKVFVMTPLETGIRVAGTAEFAALDAEPDYRRAKVLLKHASNYLNGLQTGTVTEWLGQRPMMSDSKPVISPSPRHRNVFYAFGHGHYGLTQGPTTGRIIADMVTGNQTSTDLTPFRFERFVS